MDDPGDGVAQWWTEVPAGRIARLEGTGPDAVPLAVSALPDDAPAVVTCHPAPATSPAQVVTATLDALEAVATRLFPAWLPGGDRLAGAGGAGLAAARALARDAASTGPHVAPFLADLAERSLRPGRAAGPGAGTAFPAHVRAAGLARAIAAGSGRAGVALLVEVPDGLGPAAQVVLVRAGEWLATHGRFAVWLTGAPTPETERIPPVRVEPPAPAYAARSVPVPPAQAAAAPGGAHPGVTGRPHPGSEAERRLEAALAERTWAAGRAWNQPYQSRTLMNPITVDLIWAAERCVVEIDGPEHCDRLRFEQDRRRDVRLQLDGFSVLRFTNAQVLDDLGMVLSQLEQFVTTRRRGRPEG